MATLEATNNLAAIAIQAGNEAARSAQGYIAREGFSQSQLASFASQTGGATDAGLRSVEQLCSRLSAGTLEAHKAFVLNSSSAFTLAERVAALNALDNRLPPLESIKIATQICANSLMDSSYRQAALSVLFSHAITAARNPSSSSVENAEIISSTFKTLRSLLQQPNGNTDVRLEAAKYAFRLGAELKDGSAIQNYLLGYVSDPKNGFSPGYNLRENALRDANYSK